jgi:flavin-dependent dehydrogenase
MLKRIVVVGGGTSGWMAAIALSSHLPKVEVTVIDPARIAPIGVGESVTGVVQQFVRYPFHNLDSTEFFRKTDATLKLGIKFKHWTKQGAEYLAPIDFPPDIIEHAYPEDMENFYALMTANDRSICEEQIHSKLMRVNRTDYVRKDGSVSKEFSSASCHFDALKFAAWLKDLAPKRDNITHVDDAIKGFERDSETGFVTKVFTTKGGEVEGDFFVDCTGFRRALFGEAYLPKWIDYSQHIKVDSAIPSFRPHPEGREIPVNTVARAMPHGWMWEIPTQARMGLGYVFSSQYASDEQAIQDMRDVGVEVGDSPRIIRFKPGKFATQWEGNVCALGLAGGIIEPLESTTIHIADVQIKALAELFLPYFTPQSASTLSKKYNTLIDTMYTDFVDFVSFHYHAGREDTDFWRDYQRPESITDANKTRMETWAHSYPAREDFSGIITHRFIQTTGIVIWMPMLCGLGLLNKTAAIEMLNHTKWLHLAQANMTKYMQLRDHLTANAASQREVVRYLRGDG